MIHTLYRQEDEPGIWMQCAKWLRVFFIMDFYREKKWNFVYCVYIQGSSACLYNICIINEVYIEFAF